MIELYFWTTPNGYKPLIMLEELGLDYDLKGVNISTGEQFEPAFLKIAPNNRIPAMVDRAPAGGGEPLSLFESGAILEYLAEKSGKFLSSDLRARWDTLQWLYWQMGGFGPMLGQNHHFSVYAPEQIPYAIDRYVNETARLYGVLDKRLADRAYVAGDYSIADMAIYPWSRSWERQRMDIETVPNVKRWMAEIEARPAVQRAYEKGGALNQTPTVTEEAKKILFGQGAQTKL